MFSREPIVDKNFIERVRHQDFPKLSHLSPNDVNLSNDDIIDLVESQMLSRHIDFSCRRLRADNCGFYTISSAGHECNVVAGHIFEVTDPAFLHYRSGAFFIQRSKRAKQQNTIRDILLSAAASCLDPIAKGRHKVFGSSELNVPPQTSTIASHLPKAMGYALGVDKRRVLKLPAQTANDAVTLCSFGDASLNHSTAMGALNTASWCAYQKIPMAIVFMCEDNGLGISVKTPQDWVFRTQKGRPGFQYFEADGIHLLESYRATKMALEYARNYRRPVFLHLRMVRMLGHAGSDIETSYHSFETIEANEARDPLIASAAILAQNNILKPSEIIDLYERTRQHVAAAEREVKSSPKISSREEVMASIVPPPKIYNRQHAVSDSEMELVFGNEWKQISTKQSMAKLINWTLIETMLRYKESCVFGEDVAQKGGVYHVTAGLRARFGPSRVFNSPLDEQSILGTAIGLAQNGFIAIPEIQYLAYVHNAEDQIRGEAATLSFFSDGQFVNPMIVRIPGLAYQKGFGGHFHNDNSITLFRDIPGLIVACPSRPSDAVCMLRECVRLAAEEGRICIFLEPIALYNVRDLLAPKDNLWAQVFPEHEERLALGNVRTTGDSNELVIISYGNGHYMAQQARTEIMKKCRVEPKIIDLCWLCPLPETALYRELLNAKRILIVDECRKSGSVSEAIITFVVEKMGDRRPAIQRITGADSFIPLGPPAQYVLVQVEDIVQAAAKLMRIG